MNETRDVHARTARLEALDLAIQALVEAAEESPVLVEGPRDLAALRELGVAGDVRVVNRGDTLVAVVESLQRDGVRVVILLQDWDRTGGRLQRRLRELFEAHAIRVVDEHRLALLRAVGNEARDVESIPRVRARLRAAVEEAQVQHAFTEDDGLD